eukprot:scaffold1754_cov105-Cylindrotheca_fusiformis.AAC.13
MAPKIYERDDIKSSDEMLPGERSLLLEDDDAANPTDRKQESDIDIGTTAALAFTMLVQSYLLVSVFPYSGFMAMFLIPGLNEETAGSYAGLIASSFMAGRTCTSFHWGKAADRHGRIFVIRSSLLLSAVFSILFGLAPTFHVALFWRFVLGLCNGMMGPIKTLVSEVAHGNQKKETRMMALILGMWGYGFLINPAIGGYLSDPVKQYPDAEFVEVLEPVLKRSPFLLPNVVGCLFCLIAFFLVGHFVEETLPSNKIEHFSLSAFVSSVLCRCCRGPPELIRRISSIGLFQRSHSSQAEVSESDQNKYELPKWLSPSPSTASLFVMGRQADPQSPEASQNDNADKGDQSPIEEEEKAATIRSLWGRRATRQHLLVYWAYSFLIICIDETFPLFCISKDSGLAVQEKTIGNLMSGTGLFYISFQYFLLTGLVDRFGLYKALRIGAIMSVPLCCLIPTSLWTNLGAPQGQLTVTTLVFLSMIYATIRVFSSVAFSALTMSTNKTVEAHHRATMNGFAMLGGSMAKAAGPAFAGLLFSSSVGHITPPFGSVLAYMVISTMGVCLSFMTFFLQARQT